MLLTWFIFVMSLKASSWTKTSNEEETGKQKAVPKQKIIYSAHVHGRDSAK